MILTEDTKTSLISELVSCLRDQEEIRRIVVFGSFLKEQDPHDLDVAVFQDSDQSYLPLALKYRKMVRPISRRIPVDVVPLRFGIKPSHFLEDIESGEIVYEG